MSLSTTSDAPRSGETTEFSARSLRAPSDWAMGNTSMLGSTMLIVSECLCETLDLRAGMRVLDVAAGTGNASLAAARRWCDVTSTDLEPSLLSAGQRRADAEGLPIRFKHADVEALPFSNGVFDVVISTFGAMFASDAKRAADEIGRVVRVGGRIGLASWTPESVVGRMMAIGDHYRRRTEFTPSPTQWGSLRVLASLFPSTRYDVMASAKSFAIRSRSIEHYLEVLRTQHGPTHALFATLSRAEQDAYASALMAVLEAGNRADDGTLVAPSEYLEVVIERTV